VQVERVRVPQIRPVIQRDAEVNEHGDAERLGPFIHRVGSLVVDVNVLDRWTQF